MWIKLILYIFLLIFLFWNINAFFNWIIKFSSAKIQSWCCGWISPPTNPLLWLHSNRFCFHLSWINQQHICTSWQLRHDWTLGFLSPWLPFHPPIRSQDLAPALALLGQCAGPCHQGQIAVLIGWVAQICYTLEPCTSYQAWLPVREGVKAVAAMVWAHSTGTCHKKEVICCRFHSRTLYSFEGGVTTYQRHRMAGPPSGSVGHNHWSKSSH